MKKVDFKDSEFTKSIISQYSSNRCVQVAIRDEVVGLRDSKDLGKTTLTFTVDEWRAFIDGAKAGEFDV